MTTTHTLRGISENEEKILNHVMMWGSSGYPVQKVGSHHWTWGPFFGVNGSPRVYPTKREAVASFESFLSILRDAKAGRI